MTDVPIHTAPLPIGSIDKRASGWFGMLMLIMTEAALFIYLLFSYYYFYVQYGHEWLPAELPKFRLSVPNTVILLASSGTAWLAEQGIHRGDRFRLALGLAATLLLGIVFMGIQGLEWGEKPFGMATSAYGSMYFTLTGFHMAHVAAGLIMLGFVMLWALLGYFDRERNAAVTIAAAYWHFVDAVWLTLFFTIYITPRLG